MNEKDISKLLAIICTHRNAELELVKSRCGKQKYVICRHEFWYFLKIFTNITLSKIGSLQLDTSYNYASVSTAINNIKNDIEIYKD